MRFVNDKIHGILDYVTAIALIAIPFLANFQAESAFAHWFSVVGGAGLFLYSLVTSYSLSARNLLSFKAHLVLDFTAGIAFLLVPFIIGFGGVPRTIYLAVGIAVVGLVLVTKPETDTQEVTMQEAVA